MSGFPVCVVFEHGVESDQELSHAGDVDDLEWLAGVFEAFGEGFDDGVRSFCGESRHVEIVPNGFSSAADGALTAKFSAIVIEGSETTQRRDFLSVEFAEFRKFGNEGCGSGGADSGSAAEDVLFVAPVIVRVEEFEDGVLDLFDLLVELIDDVLDAGADFLDRAGIESILFGGAELDELPAAYDAGLELGLFFRRFGHDPRANLLSEVG